MTQFYSRIDTDLQGDVYSIPFSYIKEEEIFVFINDEVFTDWYFLNKTQIKLNTIPSDLPQDTQLSIRRITNIENKIVDYTNNTLLNKENLNLSQDQLLHAVQEIYDSNIQFEVDIKAEVDEKVERVSEAVNKLDVIEESVQTALDAVQEAESIIEQGEQLITDISKEVDKIEEEINRAEDKVNYIDNTIDTINAKVSFNLFDTKISDHIFSGSEAKGWALQGTWVYKEAITGERFGYPTFYETCRLEKTRQAAEPVTLGNNTIPMYFAENGHIYYDVKDKAIVDAWYNLYGLAWFYGVDEENKRIFLPRNDWFEQMTGTPSEVGESVEAGLPNITGSVYNTGAMFSSPTGAFTVSNSGTTRDDKLDNKGNRTFTFDASLSNPIYGKSTTVQPNAVKKLLYICVGNTEVSTSWINIVEQTQAGVSDINNAKTNALQELTALSENSINSIQNTSSEAQRDLTELSTNNITGIQNKTTDSLQQINTLTTNSVTEIQTITDTSQSELAASIVLVNEAITNANTAITEANTALEASNEAVEKAQQALESAIEVEEKAQQALEEADNAAIYSANAQECADNALLYANQAQESANTATEQATQAATSATNSAESADRAADILNSIENNENIIVVLENKETIKTIADNIEEIKEVEENKNIVLEQVSKATEQANIAKEQGDISYSNATIAIEQANKAATQAQLCEQSVNTVYEYTEQVKENIEQVLTNTEIATTQANIATEQANLTLSYSTAAKTSEQNAKISENKTKTSEQNALSYANKAKEYAESITESVETSEEQAQLSKDYSELSKQWAISDTKVENTDYSSKYYAKQAANQAKQVTDTAQLAAEKAELAKKWAIDNGYVDMLYKSARAYAQEAMEYKTNAQSYASTAMSASSSASHYASKAKEYAEQAGKTGAGLGLPIGSYVYLSNTEHYPLENLVYCDGTEYTKEQFNDFYMNYLYTLPEVAESIFNINDNTVIEDEENHRGLPYITNFNSPIILNLNQPEMFAFIIAFYTGDDVTTKQIIYESPSDGSMLYIENGYFYTEKGILRNNEDDVEYEDFYALPNHDYTIISYMRDIPPDEENDDYTTRASLLQTIDWNFHPEKEMWGKVTQFDYGNTYNLGYSSNDEYSSLLGDISVHDGHCYWIDSSLENMYPFYKINLNDDTMTDPALMKTKLVTCSYEEYENEISEKGYCDKFALDLENEKFKVPTLLDNGSIKNYIVVS